MQALCRNHLVTSSTTKTSLPKMHHNSKMDTTKMSSTSATSVLRDSKEEKSPKSFSFKELLYQRVHILQWLPTYTRDDILSDFIAGLTVGLTMIPQSLAYAGLAGVSPEYGLYTAFMGSFTYIFFGTIREVSIGPTSLMSLLTFSFTKELPIECVILLSFLAGCVEFLMGILNLGFMVDFISPCLTSGFTSATSIIIFATQMKNFLGISIKSHGTFGIFKELSVKYGQIKLYDTLLGCGCIVFLLILKNLTKIPTKNSKLKKLFWFLSISKNALTVLISSVAAFIFVSQNGEAPFKLTGSVPEGMPSVGFPSLSATMGNQTMGFVEMVSSLGSGVIIIPVVAVLANVAIAKAYSADVPVDASQEMMTLGLCNIFGSFVKALPSCGAFTRSSVASSSDVRTPLQGVYSGTVIVLALSFLAKYFFFIPKAALAAVLMTAASTLIDFAIFPVLWRTNKLDFVLTLATFIIGSIRGVETAIVIGAVCNLIALLKIWSRPQITTEIRKTDNTNRSYLYIKPELGLMYPGADFLSEYIKKEYNEKGKLPIVLDCINMIKMDYSAAKAMESLLENYNSVSIGLALTNVNPKISKVLHSIMDHSVLKEACKDPNDLEEVIFGGSTEEVEKPLLSRKGSAHRRRSSVRSTKSNSRLGNGERKLSVYDLE